MATTHDTPAVDGGRVTVAIDGEAIAGDWPDADAATNAAVEEISANRADGENHRIELFRDGTKIGTAVVVPAAESDTLAELRDLARRRAELATDETNLDRAQFEAINRARADRRTWGDIAVALGFDGRASAQVWHRRYGDRAK